MQNECMHAKCVTWKLTLVLGLIKQCQIHRDSLLLS